MTTIYNGGGVSISTRIVSTPTPFLRGSINTDDELTQMIEDIEPQANTVTDIRNAFTGMNINHTKDIYEQWDQGNQSMNHFADAIVTTIANTRVLTQKQTRKLKKKIKEVLQEYSKKDETKNARDNTPDHTFVRYEPSENKIDRETCSEIVKPYNPLFIVKKIGYHIEYINQNLNANDHQVTKKRIIIKDISQTFKFCKINGGDTITVTDKE